MRSRSPRLILAALLALGCSRRAPAARTNRCTTSADCPAPRLCTNGVCVVPSSAGPQGPSQRLAGSQGARGVAAPSTASPDGGGAPAAPTGPAAGGLPNGELPCEVVEGGRRHAHRCVVREPTPGTFRVELSEREATAQRRITLTATGAEPTFVVEGFVGGFGACAGSVAAEARRVGTSEPKVYSIPLRDGCTLTLQLSRR